MTIQDKYLLLVGVEKNSYDHMITSHEDGLLYKLDGQWKQIDFEPKTKWQIVGLYPGLTEEQAAKCVESVSLLPDHDPAYVKYGLGHFSSALPFCFSALESFASRMEALGAYIKNPMGEKPSINWQSQNSAEKSIQQWNNYQSRTSGQWLVLMKK